MPDGDREWQFKSFPTLSCSWEKQLRSKSELLFTEAVIFISGFSSRINSRKRLLFKNVAFGLSFIDRPLLSLYFHISINKDQNKQMEMKLHNVDLRLTFPLFVPKGYE